jgi:hypothetical protein
MKIELKSISHSPSLSEETEAFTANIYINDINAGFAKNDGQGGNTNYYPKDEKGKELIAEAERYCKTLPPRPSSFDPEKSFEITLEDIIDDILNKHLSEREILKFNKKMEKQMGNGVVFGIPEKSFSAIVYKIPLTTLLSRPNGKASLTDTIKSIIPELKDGTIILNTNIPEDILKSAGLKEDQYVKAQAVDKLGPASKQVKKGAKKL